MDTATTADEVEKQPQHTRVNVCLWLCLWWHCPVHVGNTQQELQQVWGALALSALPFCVMLGANCLHDLTHKKGNHRAHFASVDAQKEQNSLR